MSFSPCTAVSRLGWLGALLGLACGSLFCLRSMIFCRCAAVSQLGWPNVPLVLASIPALPFGQSEAVLWFFSCLPQFLCQPFGVGLSEVALLVFALFQFLKMVCSPASRSWMRWRCPCTVLRNLLYCPAPLFFWCVLRQQSCACIFPRSTAG